MKFLKSKFITMFLISILLITTFGSISAFATTIGEPLIAPEAGWTRVDGNDEHIQYTGTWSNGTHASYYNGTYMETNVAGSYATLKFNGTKLRIINPIADAYSSISKITIDAVDYTFSSSSVNTYATYNILVFEKTGLTSGIHTVTITNTETGKYTALDAIDIDGQLIDINTPSTPTNLTAVLDNNQVNLSWNAVSGATSYNVKRSTTQGGTYTSIANNIATTTYSDSSVETGITYYYVVTAVANSLESSNSNEVSATISAPETSGKALLVITMMNGLEKEYDLSMSDVDSFISWYNSRQDGTGNAYYAIEKNAAKGPFTSRKDYILYDKVLSFEVNEYQVD